MFMQQRVMSWCLVIEEEDVFSRCTDFVNTGRPVYKCVAARCAPVSGIASLVLTDWPHRVTGEDVLDVGQEQFLVLLLMIDSQQNEGAQFWILACRVSSSDSIDVSTCALYAMISASVGRDNNPRFGLACIWPAEK